MTNFEDIVGKVVKQVTVEDDWVSWEFEDGSIYVMFHEQECCENVYLYDIDGDLNSLVGQTIMTAYESTQERECDEDESSSWTFYRVNGICLRWIGESNGCYSESVDFVCTKMPD